MLRSRVMSWSAAALLCGAASHAVAVEPPTGAQRRSTVGAVGAPPAIPATAPLPDAATAMAPAAAARTPVALPVPEPVKVSADPRPSFSPATFVATMSAVERYRILAEAGGWPMVPNGITLAKTGERSAAVAALRRRLATTGDLAPDLASGDALDAAVPPAVSRFQARHGLPETGTVGPRTLAELNVPVDTRIRQLQASAARLMGTAFPFGERYVAVNIPSATVEAVQGGAVVRRYVAIVGKTDRPSPSIMARIQSVNFNPTWTVPVSLIRKDIIPHVRADPGYLAKMKIRVLDGMGQEVDPKTIDWQKETAVNYLLRQDSGGENSLGEVRIDMPNKLAVYMHDTPSKRLFARNTRLMSSGCVRVAGVRDLAGWLLEGTAGPTGAGSSWGPAEMAAAIASGQRQDVKLVRSVPVAWVYLTGYAMPDGTVNFRPDVYGLDAPAGDAVVPGAPVASAPLPGVVQALTIEALVTGALAEKRP